MSASFPWTPLSEQAAELLATGKSIAKVARLLDCGDTTIDRWKRHPEFKERVAQRKNALRAQIRHRAFVSLLSFTASLLRCGP